MRSSGADQLPGNIDDTARLPSLPSSFVPDSLTLEGSTVAEDSAPPVADPKVAVLGPTLCFKGDLSAEEDFTLQGRIEGSIHQTQRIVIDTGGVVVGTIYARVVVVDGNVEGDLHGLESVTVHNTGRVVGNIFAPRISLVEGAVFNGRIDMSGSPVANQVRVPAEQPEKVQTPKVSLVPPPAARERTG